jgi:NitT/TauT family transport system substrate-binding protein
MSDRHEGWSRREFVGGLTLAGTAGFFEVRPERIAAEPPPETTTLKVAYSVAVCEAPSVVAEALLKGEGFTHVQYTKVPEGRVARRAVATGESDITVTFLAPVIVQIDAGEPMTVLARVHVGCLELFATHPLRSIAELKGKAVGITAVDSNAAQYALLAPMMAYVGLDPRRDITWVIRPVPEQMSLLADGKIDAFLAYPTLAQELRARKIGHVVVDTGKDRPWSQYFCCMVAGNREFVRKQPVATKRAVRAILKATQVCAAEPERTAHALVASGFTGKYDYALQTLKEIPYARWREYNPEDAIRFYSLRLNEVGVIKSGPQKIIAQGTEWRFLNELKKELKG